MVNVDSSSLEVSDIFQIYLTICFPWTVWLIVTVLNAEFAWFLQYLRYCNKCDTIVFSLLNTIWAQFHFAGMDFVQSWLIRTCYLFLRLLVLQAVQAILRIITCSNESTLLILTLPKEKIKACAFTSYSGRTFVISRILMDWGKYFTHWR